MKAVMVLAPDLRSPIKEHRGRAYGFTAPD
jgi:hypothetical protein